MLAHRRAWGRLWGNQNLVPKFSTKILFGEAYGETRVCAWGRIFPLPHGASIAWATTYVRSPRASIAIRLLHTLRGSGHIRVFYTVNRYLDKRYSLMRLAKILQLVLGKYVPRYR